MLTAEKVRSAILKWPGLYETKDGRRFKGMPVSQVPSQLRDCGWKNVSHLDGHDFHKLGLEIVDARYIGGASPKRFCQVIVAKETPPYSFPHLGHTAQRCSVISFDVEDHDLEIMLHDPVVFPADARNAERLAYGRS